MERRAIGSSGLSVTPLCFGTSGLGNMPDTYGYEVPEGQAHETIHAIFDSAVNFLDTSNNYGLGRSETRVGDVIRERGGLPDGFVLSTKLDRDMETGRFDAERVRASIEESLERLSLDRVPLLHLHDPEHARDLTEVTREGGALDALFKLKEDGVAQAVGLAMGRIDIMFPLLRSYPFDALISHNRFTLLNISANEMFDYAQSYGMAVLNAAPYAGGVFAKGSMKMPKITYQEASEEALSPVKRIEALCAEHGLPPGALALQFSMRDPRITSTIVGVSKPARVKQTLAWSETAVTDALWNAIEAIDKSSDDPEANRDYRPG